MKDVESTPISKFIAYQEKVVKNLGTDPDYILNQPGGGQLHFRSPVALSKTRRARNKSMINCGKTLIKGGFNPNSEAEVRDVYSDKID